MAAPTACSWKPAQVGKDGELVRLRVTGVDLLRVDLLGDVQPGAERQAQVGQRPEPRVELVDRQPILVGRLGEQTERAPPAALELAVHETPVFLLRLGVVLVRRGLETA